MQTPKYKRILLKFSGEALAGQQGYGIDAQTIQNFSKELVDTAQMGVQIAIVIGGGNIFRGISGATQGMDRAQADYMGMLATVMNALAVQDCLEKMGLSTRVLSAIAMQQVCEPFIRRRAIRHMEKGRVVICAAGSGNPYFTTDTAAALRAMELGCQILLKGTKVDGIYDKDPKKFDDAVKYKELNYKEVLEKNLKVMDGAAIALARDNNLPILVYDMFHNGNLKNAVMGENVGTIVK